MPIQIMDDSLHKTQSGRNMSLGGVDVESIAYMPALKLAERKEEVKSIPTTDGYLEEKLATMVPGSHLPLCHSTRNEGADWITSDDILKMGNLPYLNGLRAIASIMVNWYHICKPDSRATGFFGSFALSTHFVQGGFLITGGLLYLQKANYGKGIKKQHVHLPRFFVSRWVRLYPALVLMIIVTAIWWEDRHQNPLHLAKMIFRTIFKIQHTNILEVADDPPNPFAHTWFLDVQEAFYLFWSLALPFIALLGTKRRALIILIMIGFSLRSRLKVDRFNATLPINLWKMVPGAALQLLPIPRAFVYRYAHTIAIFSLIAAFSWGASTMLEEQLTDKYKRVNGDVIGVICTVAVTLAAIAAKCKPTTSSKLDDYDDEDEDDDYTFFAKDSLLAKIFSPLSWLDSDWLSFVGRISYSWYLWQVPMMHYEDTFMGGCKGTGSTAEAFIIALCSTFWIEEPIRNFYQARFKKKRPTTPHSGK